MLGRRMLQRSRFQMLGLNTITDNRSTITDSSLQETACSAAVLASFPVHICLMMVMCLDLAVNTVIMLLWPLRMLLVTSSSDNSVCCQPNGELLLTDIFPNLFGRKSSAVRPVGLSDMDGISLTWSDSSPGSLDLLGSE